MKVLSLVCLCTLIIVNANNLPKPNSSNNSSENDLTEDENDTNDQGSLEDCESHSGTESLHDSSNNPVCLNDDRQLGISSQPKGNSPYKRVYIGKDSSGTDIYKSSSTVLNSTSLAENLRNVFGRLEIVHKRKTSLTNGKCLANPFHKLSTKRKRMSDGQESKRRRLSFPSSTRDVRGMLNQGHSEHGLHPSIAEEYSENALSEMGNNGTNSVCEIVPPSTSPGNSRSLTLPPIKHLQDHLGSTKLHKPLKVTSSPLNKPALVRNHAISEAPLTRADLRSGQFMIPDAPASTSMLAISPKGPSTKDKSSIESSNLFSIEECYTRLRTLNIDGAQFSAYDSLTDFAAAANALQVLVEDLDTYFGSARRIRSSLQDRPQESILLVEEIFSFLRLMTSLSHPEAMERFRSQSRSRLGVVSLSVMHLNSVIRGHIINFNNSQNQEEQRMILHYLLNVLRKIRNDVGAVVESAQPVLEYFQTMQREQN